MYTLQSTGLLFMYSHSFLLGQNTLPPTPANFSPGYVENILSTGMQKAEVTILPFFSQDLRDLQDFLSFLFFKDFLFILDVLHLQMGYLFNLIEYSLFTMLY